MRKQHLLCAYAGLAALLALPGTAFAQQGQAYTSSSVHLRAGPAQDYPVVAQLAAGVPLTVMGCISDYSWCDVTLPNLRGWIYAGRLTYPYQGNNVPLYSYGSTLGLPIITFSLGSYWGNYYRGRPFYGERDRWIHHPPPRPRPRPPGHMGPPGGHGGPGGHYPGRPPGARPPDGHFPGGRPPGARPPEGRPPGGRPPEGHPGGRPPGGHPPTGHPPPAAHPPGARPPGGGGHPPGGGGRPPPQHGGGGHPAPSGGHPGGGGGHGGGEHH